MNKDALLATLIGFAIGLLITGIMLVSPNLTKALPKIKLPSFTTKQNTAPEPTPTPSQFTITIESPLEEAIENTDTLLVSGTTRAGASVVIAGPVDEAAVVSQGDGTYAGKITLTEGKNDITVTSYSQMNQTAKTVTVYYTPEEL